MHNNFVEMVKKHVASLPDVKSVYVFGSVLDSGKTPNDIDILIIYFEYTNATQMEIENFVKKLEAEINLPIDITALSCEEEREVHFLNRIKSLQLK